MCRNRLAARQLPGAGVVTERLAGQGTDRADVDHVARQLGVDRLAQEGFDLGMLATVGHAQLHGTRHFLTKAHATCAMDAAAHLFHGDQRADFLVKDHALFFFVTRLRAAVTHGQVLQLALTALVADGAIERVVDQQKLHDRLLRRNGFVALGAHDHALRHRRGAGGHGLGGFFDLDQAHAAVGRDGEFLVVAEMGDVGAGFFSGMHHHAAFGNFHFLTVEFYFNHGSSPLSHQRRPCRSCARCGVQIRDGNA